MCRYSDPDSAGSSFSMLLGNAPHLDGQVGAPPGLLYVYYDQISNTFKRVVDWNLSLQQIVGAYTQDSEVLRLFQMVRSTCFNILMVVDWQYAVFGKVTKGDEVLSKLEELPTRREGIFVMVSFLFFFPIHPCFIFHAMELPRRHSFPSFYSQLILICESLAVCGNVTASHFNASLSCQHIIMVRILHLDVNIVVAPASNDIHDFILFFEKCFLVTY
jgi:cyclophilin family peptidyl-prolyl cis-trans isomerase